MMEIQLPALEDERQKKKKKKGKEQKKVPNLVAHIDTNTTVWETLLFFTDFISMWGRLCFLLAC